MTAGQGKAYRQLGRQIRNAVKQVDELRDTLVEVGSQIEAAIIQVEGRTASASHKKSRPSVNGDRNAEPLALSIQEAARLLSVGRTSIYRLIADGQLPTVKIGRRSLIPAESIWKLVHIRRKA